MQFGDSNPAPAAVDPTNELPSVVCKSEPPYSVVYANSAWEQLCGWSSHEMLGVSLRCLQGPATDQAAIEGLMAAVRKQEACTVPNLINYDKRKRPFSHSVEITPIASPSGRTDHFRATSHQVRLFHTANRSGSDAFDALDARAEALDLTHARGAVDTTPNMLMGELLRGRSSRDLFGSTSSSVGEMLFETGVVSPPRPLSTPKRLCTAPPNGGSFAQMVVLTGAVPPYGIMWASPAWLDVCGFSLAEIVGRTLSCIQGPATDKHAIGGMMQLIKEKEGCTIHGLVNYDKKRRPFKHTLTVFPVKTSSLRAKSGGYSNGAPCEDLTEPGDADDEISHYRAESTEVSLSCGGIFAPAINGFDGGSLADEPEEEEQVWGCDFEDFLFSMGSFAVNIESKAPRRRP